MLACGSGAQEEARVEEHLVLVVLMGALIAMKATKPAAWP